MLTKEGEFTWRSDIARDLTGSLYSTHGLGPVAQWLEINRGDRMESLVALASPQASLKYYAAKNFGADHPAARLDYAMRDMVYTLIKTAKGKVIDLQFDETSSRPHPSTTHFYLQGLKAAYKDEDAVEKIWIEGKSEKFEWEPLVKYEQEFDHPLWNRWKNQAIGSGHKGADYFEIAHFMDALRAGKDVPIDVYDCAAWCSIIPLSAKSLLEGGTVQEIPDFTKGMWKQRI